MFILQDLLGLPRPEYAKQTELVLVDLLWRSKGSSLGAAEAIRGLPRRKEAGRPATRRLVLEQLRRSNTDITETARWVRQAASDLVGHGPSSAVLSSAVMGSIMAPQSRGDRSRTCVPVHRGVVPLQTLGGAVNKDNPPDLARAVEEMARLGGAGFDGAAAALLASALDDVGKSEIDGFLDRAARTVWDGTSNAELPDWPGTLSTSGGPLQAYALERSDPAGPPAWFWSNWQKLLDPSAGWRRALPERRFVDWATCLLRTGLALTYLWEGAVFRALRDLRFDDERAWGRLRSLMLDPTLLWIHPHGTPPGERDVGSVLNGGLGDGYFARLAFHEASEGRRDENVHGFRFSVDEEPAEVRRRLNMIEVDKDDAYRDPRRAPKTLREFVRYLLLARVSNDSSPDEADFYFMARTKARSTWIEPGPEWLVVVASLACDVPGGRCTLKDVSGSLRRLGVRLDRTTLVRMLEDAGLTQDSPDADEAIVVNSGF